MKIVVWCVKVEKNGDHFKVINIDWDQECGGIRVMEKRDEVGIKERVRVWDWVYIDIDSLDYKS